MRRFANQVALTVALASFAANAIGAELGATYQTHCAACHLPDGSGVPGAFPRLKGRLASFASTDSGRAYLVQVLAKGLVGPIEIDGTTYQGVMPAQSVLSDADIAEILNELVADVADIKPFQSEEVAALRAKHKDVSMPGVLNLRPSVPDTVDP